jgi:hypothetical protein
MKNRKTTMYKYYNDDKLIKSEYVIITEKEDHILISEYVDFIKSGKCFLSRRKEYTWSFLSVEEYYLKLGYIGG